MQLVERESHLGELQAALIEAQAGKGRLIAVEGPVVSGRTALLRAFAEQAERSGALVLSASCSQDEQALPFGVLSQLLHQAAHASDQAAELLSAVIELGSRTGGDTVDRERGELFHRLCVAALDRARRQPMVVCLDDLRHADADSCRFLLYLVRRAESAPLLLVFTDESDRQGQLPGRDTDRAELERQPHYRSLRLEPLSESGAAELVGRKLDPALAARVAPEFYAASGGNLLLLHALVEDHLHSGGVRLQGYGRALLSHLRRYDAPVLASARALAALGPDEPAEMLARLADLPPETVEESLHLLTTAGLLADGQFRHAVGAQAVLGELSQHVRTELHLRAARELHEDGRPVQQVARQLIQAGEVRDAWSVGVLTESADSASAADRPRDAAQSLELAFRAGVNESDRAQIRSRLLHAEWQTNPAVASRHLAPLTTAWRSGRLGRHEAVGLVKQLLWKGRSEEAGEILNRLRGSGPQSSPSGGFGNGGSGNAAEAAAELRNVERWLAWTFPAQAGVRRPRTADGPGHPVTAQLDPYLHSAALLSDLLVRGGGPAEADQAERVLRDFRRVGGSVWAGEAVSLALSRLTTADRAAAAQAWCDKLLSLDGGRQSPTWLAQLTAARAEIALSQGDLSAAASFAQVALTRIGPKAWGVAIGQPLAVIVLATPLLGRLDEAAKHLAQAVPQELFHTRYGLYYLHARGRYYLAAHQEHAALADFLSCGELMRGWGLDGPGLVPWRTSAAEAWLQLGNTEQARRLVQEQLARPGIQSGRTRGLSLRMLAAVSANPRKPQLLYEALDLAEEYGDRYEQARVLADLSRAQHALGESRRARTLFRRARHMANLCEAKPLCQDLLALPTALGGPDSPQAAPAEDVAQDVDCLTDSERRVAALAVRGYTNREIAEKLYVTPSTVEQHLTRVYRKLNVKRRKDLPPNLGGTSAGAVAGGETAA